MYLLHMTFESISQWSKEKYGSKAEGRRHTRFHPSQVTQSNSETVHPILRYKDAREDRPW
jgi:hypothetical protein